MARSRESSKTLALGSEHVHPDDVAYATDVDRFDFAMEVERVDGGLRILPTGRDPPTSVGQVYISEPGVVSSSPVSSQVLRPERIIGQPP